MNGEATFTIEFDGNPTPEVKWFRNGLELSSSGRYRISTKPNETKSTLIFPKLGIPIIIRKFHAKLLIHLDEILVKLHFMLKVSFVIFMHVLIGFFSTTKTYS